MIASSRLIPTVAPATSVSFSIFSNGTDLGPGLPILSIVVDHEINRIPSATLILQDGNLADQTFGLSESGQFDPGNEIEISLGYQGTNESVFKGQIVSQRIKLRAGKSMLVVICKDASYKMTLKRQSRYFEDYSDSDAIEELINAAGLSADVSGPSHVVPELTQHLASDWDFLVSRAEANGLVVLVENSTLVVKSPELDSEPSLKLEYGGNLVDFDAEVDARNQVHEVESYSWRSPEEETVSETNTPSGQTLDGDYSTEKLSESHDQSPIKQVHGGGVETQELIDWSSATARFSSLSRVRGIATFQGSNNISIGSTIELDKMGAVYNGLAYVSGLRHELSSGQWNTIAQLGIDPERFTERFRVSAPPAAGLIPATSGLHIGTVVQMHDDPGGEERIQITLPATAPEGSGNWARLATGLGGAESGLTFRPAVGDEVVVGFLHADPRYPIILGSLQSSAAPSALPPSEDNEQTGYVSRAGQRFVFDDNEESIVLENPSGDSLSLLGKDGSIVLADQNGNKIEMSSSGIVIESASDIKLKATGSLKIEGMSLELKASTTGKIEAGATMSVKGSLLQLN